METTIAQRFNDFLIRWIEWIEDGAPQNQPFGRNSGLCLNFWTYLGRIGASHEELTQADIYLRELFAQDGLNPDYPFGAEGRYAEQLKTGAMHLDAARVAWAKSKVASAAAEPK